MRISFLGAARRVTGSCYLVEHENTKFLVDCGMFQGSKSTRELNYKEFVFDPKEIDFVILTHAHIDHSGLLPKLCKQGFQGKIYSTFGTADLCRVMLPDSGHIQETEVEYKNRYNLRKGKPLIDPIYTIQDAQNCLHQFEGKKYRKSFEPAKNVRAVFRNAGHILGSALVEVWLKKGEEEKKIVFSGDLGRKDTPIINDPCFVEETDFLVVESTYGNRFHEPTKNSDEELVEAINSTLKNNGNVIIPSFAVERTQELLFRLHQLQEEGRLSLGDVFLDSPLAIEATRIFCNHEEYYDEDAKSFLKETQACPFIFPTLKFSQTTNESIAINEIKGGAVIISASGMADAGRVRHHLRHNLWRPESTVIFVGYQAEGTLGRKLVDGAKKVRIYGEEIQVNARILMLGGYSAHADQGEIKFWLDHFKQKPTMVFVTHGEEQGSLAMAKILQEEYEYDTEVPALGEVYDLDELKFIPENKVAEMYVDDTISELHDNIYDLVRDLINEKDLKKLKDVKKSLKGFLK